MHVKNYMMGQTMMKERTCYPWSFSINKGPTYYQASPLPLKEKQISTNCQVLSLLVVNQQSFSLSSRVKWLRQVLGSHLIICIFQFKFVCLTPFILCLHKRTFCVDQRPVWGEHTICLIHWQSTGHQNLIINFKKYYLSLFTLYLSKKVMFMLSCVYTRGLSRDSKAHVKGC